MKLLKIILGFFLAIVVLLIIPALILRFNPMFQPPEDEIAVETVNIYQAFPTPGSDLDFIESDADIKILSSANEIDSFVRFNLPPFDLPEFLESTLCQTPLVSANPQEYLQGEWDQEWWQPGNSTNLFICEGRDSYNLQQVLVDKSNETTLIIYVLTLSGNYATPTE